MREAEVAGAYSRGGWCQLGLEGDESQATTGERSFPGGDDSTKNHQGLSGLRAFAPAVPLACSPLPRARSLTHKGPPRPLTWPPRSALLSFIAIITSLHAIQWLVQCLLLVLRLESNLPESKDFYGSLSCPRTQSGPRQAWVLCNHRLVRDSEAEPCPANLIGPP